MFYKGGKVGNSASWKNRRTIMILNDKLYNAVAIGDIKEVKRLIKAGADPNIVDEYATTPLYVSAMLGYIKIVTILLEARADVNHPDYKGRTPLDVATFEGNTEIVNLLKEHGAKE